MTTLIENESPDYWLGTLSATIGHYLKDGNEALLRDAYSRYRRTSLAEPTLEWLPPLPPMRGRSATPSALRSRTTTARRRRR